MALSKDEVMILVKDFLASCSLKHDVKNAYLFGSFAKGNAGEYSDIDVAIILGALRRSEGSAFDEDFEIFHEAQQYDSRLEVVCFSEDAFNRDSSMLIKQIKREGIPTIQVS